MCFASLRFSDVQRVAGLPANGRHSESEAKGGVENPLACPRAGLTAKNWAESLLASQQGREHCFVFPACSDVWARTSPVRAKYVWVRDKLNAMAEAGGVREENFPTLPP